jgi:predicted choloylglycine hydrolase
MASSAASAEPFRYPEGKHGKGELRYINGLPVLTVSGTYAEMGEQTGVLALKPADALVKHFKEFLDKKGLDKLAPVIYAASEQMFQRFPKDYRDEVEAIAKSSGADRNLIVLGNTVFDLQQILGCSGVLVSAERSKTGGSLYGRNFDFPFEDMIAEYSLVVVYRPTGKKAFMMVTFPGLLAASVAMNEDGLAMGANTVRQSGDGSPPFDPEGMPYFVAARQVMEELSTVDQFEKWMRDHSRTAMGLLLACDPKRQSIFEITTKNIGVRSSDDGLVFCTNHFLLDPMALKPTPKCWRYPILEKSREMKKFDVADVAKLISQVNQGNRTIQTMVFEPSELVLHLSLGRGPTSEKPLNRLDLKPLFKSEENR